MRLVVAYAEREKMRLIAELERLRDDGKGLHELGKYLDGRSIN